LGKDVELVLAGEETEVDKTMIEDLADPLIHLIRNAVDHGVEMPAEVVEVVEGGAVKEVVEELEATTVDEVVEMFAVAVDMLMPGLIVAKPVIATFGVNAAS
jgi:two-component system chemotaxis sensor kinase CheA